MIANSIWKAIHKTFNRVYVSHGVIAESDLKRYDTLTFSESKITKFFILKYFNELSNIIFTS